MLTIYHLANIGHNYSGLAITCKSDEFAIFNPPLGQTCSQWAQPFVDAFGGYLDNLNATSACRYCQYKVGDEFFVPLNISQETRWRDVWIIFAFFGKSPAFGSQSSADLVA